MTFLRAYLGFFLGVAFFSVSAVLLIIFRNNAVAKAGAYQGNDDPDIKAYMPKVSGVSQRTALIIPGAFAFTLPLIFLGDVYAGLMILTSI